MSKRLLFLLAALPLLANAQPRQPIEVDRIVAVVNSEAITLSELKGRVETVKRQLQSRGTPLPANDVLFTQLLERLIVEKAELQLARESGIQLGDEDLDNALRRIAESNRLTVPEFRAAVEKDGVNWRNFREEIRTEMVLSRLRDREVDSRVTVTDGEVDNYLAMVAANGDPDLQLNLAHIIIRVPEQATSDQLRRLREKAEGALMQLRNGENFGKVAAAFSDAPDAISGGQLGLRPADRLPVLYAEEGRRLKVGEISSVIRSPAGFHIIKVLQRQGATENLPAIRQTHARHILVKVGEATSEADAQRKIEMVYERLMNGGDFADLARQYSADLSSTKGGDLGWLNQGDTVPDFEKAMDGLKLNEISKPIRSPFGFHIIQVLERRSDEGSPERKRMAARQALRERKSEESFEDWIRQLRDRTYVEYKLEDR